MREAKTEVKDIGQERVTCRNGAIGEPRGVLGELASGGRRRECGGVGSVREMGDRSG